jgi:HEAT repeat protein
MRAMICGMSLMLLGLALFLEPVLGGGGTPRKEDIPKYLKQLRTSTKAKERAEAAEMIGKRGALSIAGLEDAIEPLKKSAEKDIDESVRKAATLALGKIGADPENTVPVLINVLKNDKSDPVKMAAVDSLSLFGPKAKDALPALREIVADAKKNMDKKKAQVIGMAIQTISGKKKN